MALEYIWGHHNITINDHNYYALEVAEEKLLTAQEKARTKTTTV